MIVRLVLPLILLAAAAPAPPVRDAAGNRMVALGVVKGPAWFAAKEDERSALRCTPDRRLCAQAVFARPPGESGRWSIALYDRLPTAPEPKWRIAIETYPETSRVELWPHVVVQADGGRLVGVETTLSTMYSGGSAMSTRLMLYALPRDGGDDPEPVLGVPTGASKMIRACFSEAEYRRRAFVCHDEYDFTGTLTLDPATRAGRPRFRFVAVARTFPGRVALDDDNSGKRLTRRGAVWARDPACSYTRSLRWIGIKGYASDRPMVPCGDYLDL